MALYTPLYPPYGGPPLGFACLHRPESCREVTRTLRGIRAHLWRKHKIREQMDLEFSKTEEKKDELG